MYSQSRTKAIRKGRHAGVNQRSVHQRGAKHRSDKDFYDSIYINEVRFRFFQKNDSPIDTQWTTNN